MFRKKKYHKLYFCGIFYHLNEHHLTSVHDVTGLTVDYVSEHLYWTDFLGSAAVIASSNYDGNHKINHFQRTGAVSLIRH